MVGALLIWASLILALLLLALGPAAPWLPGRLAARLGVAACVAGVVLAVAVLAAGETAAARVGLQLRLDGLSGWMLMPVLIGAAPAVLVGAERAAPLAGAMVLAVLAGDAATVLLAMAGLCVLLREPGVAVAAGCFAAAVLLLAGHGGPGFEAMRGAAPEGVLAGAVLVMAAAGLAGVWAAIWREAAGPMPAALGAFGFYVLARVTLDLSGAATPLWWGAALMGFGLGGAVLGGWRAGLGFGTVLAGCAVIAGGLAVTGLGVALAARGADVPPLAAMGLQAALLQMLTGTVALAGLGLCAAAVRAAAGSEELARLGGLLAGMRVTGLAAAVSCATVAAVPPAAGFASLYGLLQALFAAARVGGVWTPLACAVAAGAAGLASGLGALAAARLFGLGFLGRPGVVAADPAGDVRAGLWAFAGLGAVLAVGPEVVLVLTGPALRALTAGEAASAPFGVALLGPAAMAAVLAGVGAAAVVATRGPPGPRVAAWDGAAGPALAQYAPAVLGGVAARARVPRLRAPSLREAVVAATAMLAAVLIALAAR